MGENKQTIIRKGDRKFGGYGRRVVLRGAEGQLSPTYIQ